MRCPACGFVSFPHLAACKKCGKPLPVTSAQFRIPPPSRPAPPKAAAPYTAPTVPLAPPPGPGAAPGGKLAEADTLMMGAGEPPLPPAAPKAVAPSTAPTVRLPSLSPPVAGSGGKVGEADTVMLGGKGPPPPLGADEDTFTFTLPPAAAVPDVHSRDLFGSTAGLDTQLDFRPAGFWIRFLAWVVDLIVLVVLGWIVAKLLGVGGTDVKLESLDSLWNTLRGATVETAADVLISLIYSVVFVGWRGQTPGKMLLRLKIIRTDGGEVSYFGAFTRWIGEAISLFLLGIGYFMAATSGGPKALFLVIGTTIVAIAVFFIGYVMAAFTTNKRALHDYIAGTRVVRL